MTNEVNNIVIYQINKINPERQIFMKGHSDYLINVIIFSRGKK